MGLILGAKCFSCGYTNRCSFGGNKFTYMTNCMVPGIDKKTKKFVVLNYLDKQNPSDVVFYNNEELKGKTLSLRNEKIQFGDILMNSDNNFCPNCKEFYFHFKVLYYTD